MVNTNKIEELVHVINWPLNIINMDGLSKIVRIRFEIKFLKKQQHFVTLIILNIYMYICLGWGCNIIGNNNNMFYPP